MPDCSSIFRLDLVRGKKTICWGCGKEFIITAFPSDIQVRPRCKECKLDKGFRRNKAIEEKLEVIEHVTIKGADSSEDSTITLVEVTPKKDKRKKDEDDIDWDTLLK